MHDIHLCSSHVHKFLLGRRALQLGQSCPHSSEPAWQLVAQPEPDRDSERQTQACALVHPDDLWATFHLSLISSCVKWGH